MIRRALGALSACVLAVTVLAPGIQADQAPGAAAAAEARFLELLNESRTAAGLVPLVVRETLGEVAREWSTTMSSAGALSHNPDLLGDVQAALSEQVRSVAENVGHGADVDGLHGAFLASPGHRRALLDDYDLVGIGVVVVAERTWVTFDFAAVAIDEEPGQGAPDGAGTGNQPPPVVSNDAPPQAQGPPAGDLAAPPAGQGPTPPQSEPVPAPEPEVAATPEPEEAPTPESGDEPVITPEPAVEPPVQTSAAQAPKPSPAPPSSSANPLQLPGMEDLLVLGPDQLDDLTGTESGEVRTAAAEDASGAQEESSESGDERALQATAAPEEPAQGAGILRVLTLAVLGLAAAVATSMAIRPRRHRARVGNGPGGASPVPPALDRASLPLAPSSTLTDRVAAPSPTSRQPMDAPDHHHTEVSTPLAYQPVGMAGDQRRVDVRPERSISEVAGELGVDESTLAAWARAERTRTGTTVSPAPLAELRPQGTDGQLRDENERLKQRVAELEADRDLLKRATAFWVNESNG